MVNKNHSVLDAWITVEQLSEGSISRKDKSYNLLYRPVQDWKQFFTTYIEQQIRKDPFARSKKSKPGIVMYFGIFDFEEVVEILRKKYKIKKTNEDIAKSEKFTIALYFNRELKFLDDFLFLTSSGYIRNKGDFPEDLRKVENEFKEILNRRFEENFNGMFNELYTRYNVTLDNFRYKYLTDIENGDTNLHSFFISDLNRAKQLNNRNLNQYINGFTGTKINLDSNKNSELFNPTVFEEEVMQPKYYPLGRFPSNTAFALSFMQQAAVNLALNQKNSILSVNGPPGTGKTTLLKDIFADLIVQQAIEIVSSAKKNVDRTIVCKDNYKFGRLPASIACKNIIVASSNNGAVQNIVNELPKIKEIDEKFIEDIQNVNYFTYISNCHLEKKYVDNRYEVNPTFKGHNNWGTFSIEGGKASNMEQLNLTIELIIKDLKENYIPEPQVYEEFKNLYKTASLERQNMQQLSEKYYKLRKLKPELTQKEQHLKQKEQAKKRVLDEFLNDTDRKMDELQVELNKLNNENLVTANQIAELDLNRAQAERNYALIQSKKLSFLWLQKLFFRAKVDRYFLQLTNANEELKQLLINRNGLLKLNQRNEQTIHSIKNVLQKLTNEKQSKVVQFNNWITAETEKLNKLKNQIRELENELVNQGIKGLQFDLPYEELQKSNPWFTEKFRELQTKLFIQALKVRKQFLYDNVNHLFASKIIWNSRSEYESSRETGQLILREAWHWINFTIPVISTTFASFNRMFHAIDESSLGYLFIDEAGQALPQASVGAIFRSKKVVVVGDPSQIKPVLTLDSNVLNLIGGHFKVNDKFVSSDASTQTLTDAASQFGYYKTEDDWVGVPLWVHRRCNEPMFSISNTISYNGLMVQGKEKNEAKGKAVWIDVKGNARDKYVKEQSDTLKSLINLQLTKTPELANEIYVITPFRNVANRLIKDLDQIHFTKREEGRVINVGTVHTFQGKEAKMVYLVLGADTNSKGSATWAVSEPNIMNVAATRAKEEFYIIGDKQLYASLGSRVAYETIKIIDAYQVQIIEK
ncbi:AAA domain-containing protein [Lysinibacillus sphaericus]|uniref:AAA domain-containing protein n=1 Tax=Lysinibacillus sphaericus TaxID=1421 RepID=UPI003D7FCCF8